MNCKQLVRLPFAIRCCLLDWFCDIQFIVKHPQWSLQKCETTQKKWNILPFWNFHSKCYSVWNELFIDESDELILMDLTLSMNKPIQSVQSDISFLYYLCWANWWSAIMNDFHLVYRNWILIWRKWLLSFHFCIAHFLEHDFIIVLDETVGTKKIKTY